jgi:ribose-phosphate pyrophosphokinase
MAEVLNLVNPNDILSFKYEISKFPDGQQSLRLVEEGYNTFYSLENNPNGITIKSRLNTFQDLEIIICATQALKEVGVNKIRLYIPYCMGARSDRKFMDGGINYVKHVIAPIINSQGYEKVAILDPHSDVLEACINNFFKNDNTKLAEFAFKDYFLSKGFETWSSSNFDNVRLVSPDAGALKKVFHVADSVKYKKDVVIASKHRNVETGKIDFTHVPLNDTRPTEDFFIFDDICDGGRTFTEIAKVIKSHVWTPDECIYVDTDQTFQGKIYLVVTHGIFSAGLLELSKWFECVYTTNSVKDIDSETYSDYTVNKDFVKQLSIF